VTTQACDAVQTDRLIVGDCLSVLPTLPDACVNLIATDPPFNIGLDYKGYDDNLPSGVYLEMLRTFAAQSYRMLKPDGSLFLFMGQRYQARAFMILEDAGFHWRNSIVWHFTFGCHQRTKFTPSWAMIHYFARHPESFVFNADAVRVPSARQLVYNDRRAKSGGKVPDDTWVLLPERCPEVFREDQDAWLVSRVCGTFKERAGHTTQLPLPLVERIIRVASNPGDLILDPFAGSGTVLVAARNLGRRYLGVEISAQTAEIAHRRLKEANEVSSPKADVYTPDVEDDPSAPITA
jgi:site-specific DNA-methyltransferase (adenine-specific)